MTDTSDTPSLNPLCDSASKLLSDWRELLCRLTDEAEKFTREKPAVGLAVAFFAGAFLSSIFRRR
jgi:hypothetical protein